MSVFDNLKSYEFDRNRTHLFGIKSGIVWGHSKKDNSCQPLLYISKPKHITETEFRELLDSLVIGFVREDKK